MEVKVRYYVEMYIAYSCWLNLVFGNHLELEKVFFEFEIIRML